MCEDNKYPTDTANYAAKVAQAEQSQLRPAYPHENLDQQLRRGAAENRRLERAKAFLDKHPEFSEFLTLCAEGTLYVSR